MDERRLRYFLAVVDDGGVTRAASRLRVAQPSLSQSLRALERELGAALFQRVGRGLRLTAAGEALVGPARHALRTMDAARAAVGEVSELAAGTLQIAALATLAVDPLSALIGRFRGEHPGVVIRVREPDSAAAVSTLVRAGECELGLAHLPLPHERLRTVALGEQELLFVLPPGSETGNALAPAALREVPLVVSPPAGAPGRRGHAAHRRRDRHARGDRPARPRRRRRRAAAHDARRGGRAPRRRRARRATAHRAPHRSPPARRAALARRPRVQCAGRGRLTAARRCALSANSAAKIAAPTTFSTSL
jgi:DNA-binding transcriptional LysR family regulator